MTASQDVSQLGQDIRELLARLAAEPLRSTQEGELLNKAFNTAATALLKTPALASTQNINALADFAFHAQDDGLRAMATTRLGDIAVTYRGEAAHLAVLNLECLLENKNQDVRFHAGLSLRDAGLKNIETVVIILRTALTSSIYRDVREEAATALGAIASHPDVESCYVRAAVFELSETLDSRARQPYTVRMRAVAGIAAAGLACADTAKIAIVDLAKALKDKEPFVSLKAIEALGAIAGKYKDQKPTIIAILEKGLKKPQILYVEKTKIENTLGLLTKQEPRAKTPEELAREQQLRTEREEAAARELAARERREEEERQRRTRMDRIGALAAKISTKPAL